MEVTVITNIRRKVLTMLSKMAYDGNLPDHVYDILQIVNENTPRTRCCVHKERAVLKERICVALGVDTDMNIIDAANKAISEPVDRTQHVIAVLPEGCSACPVNKYMITDVCRRCLTHRCMNGCPKKAISVYQGRAHIDYDMCIECGNCKRACPYGAVVEIARPCEMPARSMPCIPVPTRRQKSTRTSVWNAVPAVGPAPSAPSRNGAISSS
jgi:Fe-S-cluster-containing hydrogenase component 2